MSSLYRSNRFDGAWAKAGLIALCAVTAGCSSDRVLESSGSSTSGSGSSSSFGDSFKQLFGGSSPATTASASAAPGDPSPDQIACPPTDVRQGASTLSVTTANPDPAAARLRYQGTFGQMARECIVKSGMLTIRVGVQGRIILGPDGTPGNIDVPLRFALVQEGPQPKVLWTKFYTSHVDIAPGQSGANFSHVVEDLTVPNPKASELDSYVIYVGFDPLGAKPEAPKKKTPPARKP